jgi:hypothetical protein
VDMVFLASAHSETLRPVPIHHPLEILIANNQLVLPPLLLRRALVLAICSFLRVYVLAAEVKDQCVQLIGSKLQA